MRRTSHLLVAVFFVGAFLGCQKNEVAQESRNGLALIRGADGTLYSAPCVQQNGMEAADSCKMSTSDFSNVSGSRGFFGWWNPHYYYSYAYTLEPSDNVCSYYFGNSGCWGSFGWNNNNWSSYWTNYSNSYGGFSQDCLSGCVYAEKFKDCRKNCRKQWKDYWDF